MNQPNPFEVRSDGIKLRFYPPIHHYDRFTGLNTWVPIHQINLIISDYGKSLTFIAYEINRVIAGTQNQHPSSLKYRVLTNSDLPDSQHAIKLAAKVVAVMKSDEFLSTDEYANLRDYVCVLYNSGIFN